MTPLDNLTDEELDALVATEVMGWHEWANYETGDYEGLFPMFLRDGAWLVVYEHEETGDPTRQWSPSTSIADAWEVKDTIRKRLFSVRSKFANELRCLLRTDDGYQLAWPDAIFHLEPRHVCLAALRAVGYGGEP